MARSHSCFFPSLLLAASPSSPSSACGCGPATLPGHCHGQVPRRRAHQQCGVGGSVREGREEVRGPGAPPGLLPRAALQRVHLGCGRHEELRGGRCPAAPMLRGAQQAEPCPRGAQDTAAVWTRVSPPPSGVPDPHSGWKRPERGRVSPWSPRQRIHHDRRRGSPLRSRVCSFASCPVAP